MITRTTKIMDKFSNRLAKETSPYLLQHANNPVDWYPWGDEAFEKAKKENKLLLISIGYSSCHWCHVMEHEAFSDVEITDFMNSNYINIKVDREEHPEVDQIYMNAVQIINRTGGWPLNCFALPDGKPVFGGTYFTKDNWLDVIKSLNATWLNEKNRVIEVAEELSQSIAGSEVIKVRRNPELLESTVIQDYTNRLKKLFDTKNGGIKGAPKFPMPGFIEYLLIYGYHFPDQEVLDHVFLTLDKIALGGIYDHLGGGFSRYAVDEVWHIPHFEKMLYDNVQLISLYSKAYRIQPKELYKTTVAQTISFLLNELKSPQGGFYAAYDADSEGREGAYYTWSKTELESHLGNDAELFSVAYSVTATGNFDEKNVLARSTSNDHLKCIFSDDIKSIERRLENAKNKLFNIRKGRIRPALDDKVIVSWNSMAIIALLDAYISFNDETYLESAITCANYIDENHIIDNRLQRINCKGTVSVDGLLEDYSFLIKSYLALYQVTFNIKWLNKAEDLLKITIADFYDSESGMFFYAPVNNTKLIARKMELTDGVISSSGSVMAQVLFDIGKLLNNEEYVLMSKQMLVNISEHFKFGGPYVYGWAKLMLTQLLPQANLTFNEGNVKDISQKIFSKIIYPSINSSINPQSKSQEIGLCLRNTCNKFPCEPEPISSTINSIKLKE
ncbi:MAG: thioredoxin domain-containing protein [Tenuifilaceae bacterium]